MNGASEIRSPRRPPRLAVRHQYFLPLLDALASTPDAYSQFPTPCPTVSEQRIRPAPYPSEVVDEPGFVAVMSRVYTNVVSILSPIQRKIIVRFSLITMHLSKVINYPCSSSYLFRRKKPILSVSCVRSTTQPTNSDMNIFFLSVFRWRDAFKIRANVRWDRGVVMRDSYISYIKRPVAWRLCSMPHSSAATMCGNVVTSIAFFGGSHCRHAKGLLSATTTIPQSSTLWVGRLQSR
jgi:hypothetical protein